MKQRFRDYATRQRERVGAWWLSLAPDVRPQFVAVLSVCLTVYVVHYVVFCWPQAFYIEDAGISFAYAQNLVDGEGLVPYPGGERVEGYSNASWTFLIAVLYALGVPTFLSAKVLGALLGAVALFASWGLARRALPHEAGWAAVLAPVLLALSTQFVLWSASGLENGLFCALLAGGAWLLAREIQDGRAAPWSAVCFFLLTMTRPDGVAYAAVALLARLMGTVVRRQWLAALAWIVVVAVPYGLYNWWRYEYFAWPWPNTYYAKEKAFKPFLWTSNGWKQFREYMWNYGLVWASPVVVLGLVGKRGWRLWVGLALVALLPLVVLWDGRQGIPSSLNNEATRWLSRNWSDARVWYLLGGSVALGGLTLGRPGWEVRGLLWASFCTGVFFNVFASGDWMKGYRWFSLTSVPLFTLIATGLAHLLPALPAAGRRIGGGAVTFAVAYAGVVVGALGAFDVKGSWEFANDPETSVRDVKRRVNYMKWVQRRLGLEDVTLLDVDMGAHMLYSGWEIVDIAGLIDVPISRHKWQKSFTEDYIFNERRPDFAHVHGSWAKTSKIPQNERWTEEYVEIPGYPTGRRSLHVGNHVRKDHLAGDRYRGPEGRSVAFAGAITLEGWEVPSPEVAPGGMLYVDTTWRAGKRDSGFRVLVFLADAQGHVHAAEVVPGYDWYKPTRWQSHDYVWGRWNVPIPRSLPEGTYEFGLVLLDEQTGEVLPPSPTGGVETAPGEVAPDAADTAPAHPARFMTGEWRSTSTVSIVSGDAAHEAAERDAQDALTRAGSGDCEGAREALRDAGRHVARDEGWIARRTADVNDAVVRCYVRQAEQQADPQVAATVLAQARRLDHRHDALLAAARPLADRLEAIGDAAFGRSDWEGAYMAWLAALQVDPQRPFVRKRLEEARDLRLGISGKEPEPAKKKVTPARPRPTPKKEVAPPVDVDAVTPAPTEKTAADAPAEK